MRRAWLILMILCEPSATAVAQTSSWLDVGASRISQANVPISTAVSLGGAADVIAPRSWFHSSALAVVGSELRASAQGFLAGSADLTESRVVRPFVVAALSLVGESGAGSATSFVVSAGARAAKQGRGISLAGSAGATSFSGLSSTLFRAQSDAWATAGVEQFSTEIAMTRSQARFTPGALLPTRGPSLQYAEGVIGWRHAAAGFSIGTMMGARTQTSSTPGGVWAAANAAIWMSPRSALTLSAANALEDVVRGIPRTRYLTAGLRFAARPHATFAKAIAVAGPRVIVSSEGSARRIVVNAGDVASVELMADFTGWEPVALDRVGSGTAVRWRTDRSIPPGPHRVAIRIGGGDWIAPANLPRVTDEFGGTAGLITLP